MPRKLTPHEAALLLGVSPSQLRKLKNIPGEVRTEGNQRRFWDNQDFRAECLRRRAAKESSASRARRVKQATVLLSPEQSKWGAEMAFQGIAGVAINDDSDVSFAGCDEAARKQVFQRLSFIEKGRRWWIGEHEIMSRQLGHPENPKAKLEAETCRFYPRTLRMVSLSFEHHLEAMQNAEGSLATALEWLKMSAINNWRLPELRAYLHRRKALLSE